MISESFSHDVGTFPVLFALITILMGHLKIELNPFLSITNKVTQIFEQKKLHKNG